MNDLQDIPSSSQKRGSESHGPTDLHPSKRRRLSEDDKDWLKCEIDDVKDHIMRIANHLQDVNSKLDEILR